MAAASLGFLQPGDDRGPRGQRCDRLVEPHRGLELRTHDAADGADLKKRLLALPGIGEMKANSLIAILVKRFGITPPGYEDVLPDYPTLGDIDSPEALADYQEKKRAYKAKLKAEGGAFDPRDPGSAGKG